MDCCLQGHNSLFGEMFHPFSPCYGTNGAERHGSQQSQHSRATEQKVPSVTSPFQPPLAWLPLSNAHLKDEPTQALQLKPGTNEKTSFSSKIQHNNSPRDTAYKNTAQRPGNVAAALVVPLWSENTRHVAVMLFHCPHAAARATRNSPVSFICHRKHRAPGTAPTTPRQLLVSTGPICPNLSPETRRKEAAQNLAAFNLPDKIRRLRAFSLLCSAAINLKWSRGR